MDLEGPFVPAEQMQAIDLPDPRESHVTLAVLECAGEIHDSRVHAHTLALVHCYCPGEAQGYLTDTRLYFAILLDRPLHRFNFYSPASTRLNYRITTAFVESDYSTKCAVHESFLHIIFSAHHGSSNFQNQ